MWYFHGLRTPNEAFFHWNPELLGLGIQIEQIFWGLLGIFGQTISTHFGTCPCFPLFNHYFLQKTKPSFISTSQIFISDWDLNLSRKELGILCVRSTNFPSPSIQFPPEKNKVLNVAKSQNIFSCSLHFQRKDSKRSFVFWIQNECWKSRKIQIVVVKFLHWS